MGLLSKIKTAAQKVATKVKTQGGLKNVVAVGKSIIKGTGVTANVKNPTVKKVLEKVATKKGILGTALVGAAGATGIKAGVSAIKGAKLTKKAKAAIETKNLTVGSKVKESKTIQPKAVNEAVINQPQREELPTATDVKNLEAGQSISNKKTSVKSQSVSKYRGIKMGKRKRTAAWYNRQTALLKAKKAYLSARGY